MDTQKELCVLDALIAEASKYKKREVRDALGDFGQIYCMQEKAYVGIVTAGINTDHPVTYDTSFVRKEFLLFVLDAENNKYICFYDKKHFPNPEKYIPNGYFVEKTINKKDLATDSWLISEIFAKALEKECQE